MTKSSGLNIIKGKDISVEDLSVQIDALKNDLSSLTSSLAEHGVGKAAEAKQATKECAETLKATATDKAI